MTEAKVLTFGRSNLYIGSIRAYRVVEPELVPIKPVGSIRATHGLVLAPSQSKKQAEQKALTSACKRWPTNEWWRNHEVEILTVDRETLVQVLSARMRAFALSLQAVRARFNDGLFVTHVSGPFITGAENLENALNTGRVKLTCDFPPDEGWGQHNVLAWEMNEPALLTVLEKEELHN